MSMNVGFNPAYADALNAYTQTYNAYMYQQQLKQQANNAQVQNPQYTQYGPAMQYPQNQIRYQQPFQGQDTYITGKKSNGVSTTAVVVGTAAVAATVIAARRGKLTPLWKSTKKYCGKAIEAVKNLFTKKGAKTNLLKNSSSATDLIPTRETETAWLKRFQYNKSDVINADFTMNT